MGSGNSEHPARVLLRWALSRRLVGVALSFMAVSVSAREPIPLVTGNGYAPLADESLPHGGRATELVRRVFAEMGRPVTIAFQPWSRGYRATLDGQFQATFPYARTPDRTEKFHFSNPLFMVRFRILVRQHASIEGAADLVDKTLCVPLGYALSRPVERLLDDIDPERERPRTMAQCLWMLERARVDFVVITQRQARVLLQEEIDDLERLETLQDVDVPARLHLIVPKSLNNGRGLIKDFNQALEELRAEDKMETIRWSSPAGEENHESDSS